MRWNAPLHESRPARSAFLAKHSRESASSGSALGTNGSSSSNWTRCALAASHEQRSRERRNLPLARRTCQSAVWPRIKIRAPGTASSPRAINARISTALHRGSVFHGSWVSGTFASSLGDSNGESRPTRPQHPTACRSLARRLRRLASARRVASRCRNREARGRVSGSPLGRRKFLPAATTSRRTVSSSASRRLQRGMRQLGAHRAHACELNMLIDQRLAEI